VQSSSEVTPALVVTRIAHVTIGASVMIVAWSWRH
jgi:hypothetical protein